MSLPIRLDLHVHSTCSPDSHLTPRGILDHIGAAGLNGVAVTDHNTTRALAAVRLLSERYPRYWIVPGVEVSAREGHVLVYGVEEAPPRDRTVEEVVEWARPRNGVVVLAHPFRWVHGAGEYVARSAQVDGLEVRNGRTAELGNRHAELVAAQRHLAAVGGSDAHEALTLGRAFTEFPEEPDTLEELLEMMRRARCQGGGRSITALGRVSLAVRNGWLRASRGFRPV